MVEISLLSVFTAFLAALALIAVLWVAYRVGVVLQRQAELPAVLERYLQEQRPATV
jgi:hypothetical protein